MKNTPHHKLHWLLSLVLATVPAVAQSSDVPGTIIKQYDIYNPAEGLSGGPSITVVPYLGGQDGKAYVAYCEKNEQGGYSTAWIYRSLDLGLTWTEVSSFMSPVARAKHDAYTTGRAPKTAAELSGRWMSPAATIHDKVGGAWVQTGTGSDLSEAPLAVYNAIEFSSLRPSDVSAEGFRTTSTGFDYVYDYRFRVAREGWGSGLPGSDAQASGPRINYYIIPGTIATNGDSFEATYEVLVQSQTVIRKRTFLRDGAYTRAQAGITAGTTNSAGAPVSAPPHKLVGPAGLSPYVGQTATPPGAGTAEIYNSNTALSGDFNRARATAYDDNTPINMANAGSYAGFLFYYDDPAPASTHDGLYLIGLSQGANRSQLTIRKSTNAGDDWDDEVSLRYAAGYNYVPAAPAYYGGRIWIALGVSQVLSAKIGDNLLDPANWVESVDVRYGYGNPAQLKGVEGEVPGTTNQAGWLAGKLFLNLLHPTFAAVGAPTTPNGLVIDDNYLFPMQSRPGFTESCVVAGPDNSGAPGVWLLPKVTEQPYTARIQVGETMIGSARLLTTTFPLPVSSSSNPNLVHLPGAEKKFTAQYVPGPLLPQTGARAVGKFYAVTSPVLETYASSRVHRWNSLTNQREAVQATEVDAAYLKTNYENPAGTRNTGAIYSSDDLTNWKLEKIFVHSSASELENVENYGKPRHGFHTFSFTIDGDDMLIVSRTAADTGTFGDAVIDYAAKTFTFGNRLTPARGLDTNLVTFHRVKNFRTLERETFLVADKDAGKVFVYEKAIDGDPAKVGEFIQYGQPAAITPGAVVQMPENNGDVFVAEARSGGAIKRYTKDGVFVSDLTTFLSGWEPVALAARSGSSLLYATLKTGTGNTAVLYSIKTQGATAGQKTQIATLDAQGNPVALVPKANGLAFAASGFVYGTTARGFARISTSGLAKEVVTCLGNCSDSGHVHNPVIQALASGGAGLFAAHTDIADEALGFSSLDNLTITAFDELPLIDVSGMALVGDTLFWASDEAKEVLSIPVSLP